MRRNKKFLIFALLASVVLAGSVGGVALARSGIADSSQPRTLLEVSGNVTQPKTLLARVAENLGIDQAKLDPGCFVSCDIIPGLRSYNS